MDRSIPVHNQAECTRQQVDETSFSEINTSVFTTLAHLYQKVLNMRHGGVNRREYVMEMEIVGIKT